MNNLAKIVLFVLVLAGIPALAGKTEEKIDNPLYKHWAQFKPGSYATLKVVTMGTTSDTHHTQTPKDPQHREGGATFIPTSDMRLTQTLKEVTAEKVVIELKTVITAGGQKMEQPPTLQDIPAKITKTEVVEQEPTDKVKQGEPEIKEGEEEIKAAGKTLKAKWVQTEIKQDEMVIKTKVWTSEDVPGQTVRMISSTEGQVASKSTTELVEFKADRK